MHCWMERLGLLFVLPHYVGASEMTPARKGPRKGPEAERAGHTKPWRSAVEVLTLNIVHK